VIYAPDMVVGLPGLVFRVLPMSSWMESEHTGEVTDGQLTANRVGREEAVTLVFSKTDLELFLQMVKNWAESEITFLAAPVVLKEVPRHFAEDKVA
jgi:hypothetical protein